MHTALLWLELAPGVRVTSFDLGDMPYAGKQGALLARAYGSRFRVFWGSSLQTVPAYHEPCDVTFLDGGKSEEMRLADLRNFATLSRPGALLLFDEATTQACVRGQGDKVGSCGKKQLAWGGASYAYHRASREGLISVGKCNWPKALVGKDGVCTARYLQKP